MAKFTFWKIYLYKKPHWGYFIKLSTLAPPWGFEPQLPQWKRGVLTGLDEGGTRWNGELTTLTTLVKYFESLERFRSAKLYLPNKLRSSIGSAEALARLRWAFLASTYPPHAAVPIKITMKSRNLIRDVGGNVTFAFISIFYLSINIKSIHIIR